LLDVVDAVSYLHNHPKGPVIHGDLKGVTNHCALQNNILIDLGEKRLIARVTDFGLAHIMESTLQDGMTTTSTAFQGNSRWMAFERMLPSEYGLRQAAAKSKASDVFELMRTFFQILTGRLPFHGKSDIEAMVAVVQRQNPERPTDHCRDLDDLRWNLMLQAWSDIREERPSLMEVQHDIAESLRLERLLLVCDI
ncbi:kinase-like protein, partial [Calocera cornea HHB12733]